MKDAYLTAFTSLLLVTQDSGEFTTAESDRMRESLAEMFDERLIIDKEQDLKKISANVTD